MSAPALRSRARKIDFGFAFAKGGVQRHAVYANKPKYYFIMLAGASLFGWGSPNSSIMFPLVRKAPPLNASGNFDR
jgi:hypothetical protein